MLETRSICPCPDLNGGAPQSDADNATSSFVTGMYQVNNSRTLTRRLIAHVCARPATITDLFDAAAFIDIHGDRTPALGHRGERRKVLLPTPA
jgi:hypothetical protein